jgi:hypothetical protein
MDCSIPHSEGLTGSHDSPTIGRRKYVFRKLLELKSTLALAKCRESGFARTGRSVNTHEMSKWLLYSVSDMHRTREGCLPASRKPFISKASTESPGKKIRSQTESMILADSPISPTL